MIETYLPVLILFCVALILPTSMVISSHLLGPKNPGNKTKFEAYECGVPAVGNAREGMAIKFYKIAILFLLFDVEAALLFPWAVIFKDKLPSWGPTFLIVEFMFFLVILLGGFFYAWKRKALDWE
ncbi:MAG: NADH-quinone oxidoreductase subunit A [Proteobacteria bacterium]|jgi:NADH-quinone oxidoreductase subunit A|nr:NADH-quinone oxidoreductase subunit A [Pseudomonadota bacterium]